MVETRRLCDICHKVIECGDDTAWYSVTVIDRMILNVPYPAKDLCAECGDKLMGFLSRKMDVCAMPVVRGEWSSIPIGLCQCTQCAKIFDYAYNYCPNCGADNRGDEHDTE